ncbi:MAG: cell division protein ZapA [Litorimonas sp.]
MGKVSLNINGRAYGLGCEDGEEERLERLGRKLDTRVAQMAEQFGQIGDLRLLVMAGITLLDEMEDPQGSVEAQVEARVGEVARKLDASEAARLTLETTAVEHLMSAAKRIDRLAGQVEDLAPKPSGTD